MKARKATKVRLRIPRKPKSERRVRAKVALSPRLKGLVQEALQQTAESGTSQLTEEELILIKRLRQSPEHLRRSSANPLTQRLKEIGGGTLDTSRRTLLYPEEARRESQREQTRRRTGRDGVSRSKKLDDWRSAPSTKDSIQAASQEISKTMPESKRGLKLPKKRRYEIEQVDLSSFSDSALSLCSTLFGENQEKTERFVSRMASLTGKLFDEGECMPGDVPLVPMILNVGNQTLGESFPSLSRLGDELGRVLTQLFRESLGQDRGQYKAVVGLYHIMHRGLSPDDCATWVGFLAFSFAFLDLCKLAAETEAPDVFGAATPD